MGARQGRSPESLLDTHVARPSVLPRAEGPSDLYGLELNNKEYRYLLTRDLTKTTIGRTCLFIMLNPSTATQSDNDPTVRRCIGFATDWGYDSLIVTNICPTRATDPKEIIDNLPPPLVVQHENLKVIRHHAQRAHLVVTAWGEHGKTHGFAFAVDRVLSALDIPIFCLGRNKSGAPKHPLYLRKDSELQLYLGRKV